MPAPTRRMYIGVTAAILLFIPAGVIINYWGPAIRDAWRFRKLGRPLEQKGKVTGYLWGGGNGGTSYELDLSGEVVRQWTTQMHCFQIELLRNGNILLARGKRAVELSHDDTVVWSSSSETPVHCEMDITRLANGNTLVADFLTGNRVVEFGHDGAAVWKHEIQGAHSAQRLTNGNTLIGAYEGSGGIVEVTPAGEIVWEKRDLNDVACARRLANGNTLFVRHTSRKIIEVNPLDEEVWSYECRGTPLSAERLPDASTLVTQQSPGEIFLVTPDGEEKMIAKGLADGKAQPIYSMR